MRSGSSIWAANPANSRCGCLTSPEYRSSQGFSGTPEESIPRAFLRFLSTDRPCFTGLSGRYPGVPECRISGVPENRSSGVLVVRYSGVMLRRERVRAATFPGARLARMSLALDVRSSGGPVLRRSGGMPPLVKRGTSSKERILSGVPVLRNTRLRTGNRRDGGPCDFGRHRS